MNISIPDFTTPLNKQKEQILLDLFNAHQINLEDVLDRVRLEKRPNEEIIIIDGKKAATFTGMRIVSANQEITVDIRYTIH